MAYIGQGIKQGTFKVLDTSGNTYNGSNTTFSLGTQVGSAAQLLVSHDGVIQLPGTDYTLASGGASITFSTAPASGASIFIVEISGAVGGTVTPSDASVTSAKLSGNLETPGTLDVNGQELILDADGDTTITADTDDQIDIKIAGADDFQFTANTFTAASGSGVVIPDGGLTLGSTAVSSTAAELNILDGVTATAAELNLLDGGTSVGSSITLADADGFVVNDGGTMKTIPATDVSTYAGGGNLIKIGQVNLGSSGNLIIDDCFNTTYDNYLVVMENVRCTVDSQSLRFRFRTGGSSGSTDTSSQYRYASKYFDDDGSSASNTGVDQQQFQITDDSEEAGDWKGFCGTFTFYQPYKATSSRYSGHGSFIRNDKTDIVASYNAGHFDSNVQHTGLDFFYSSGDVAAGSVVIVYAFKE